MYLKSLVLKGFKSFADRSVISLEPGITAVVGPNGSGKSNISDAVLWVLGERNAKNLRGQAMEDVIFSGSTARKSVSVAEVELTLDNSDGTLPVEFDEVSLTRRMYRSGESEYLINGSPARRMDFLDILHDSGLGTGTHSIISQGNLDSILSSKPGDRRALIEEAAGVLKHKQRKEKATRKLQSLDDSLGRAKDISREVERQLKPLARKAQRAKAYQGLSEQLNKNELILAVDNLRGLKGQWEQNEVKEREAAAAIDVAAVLLRESEEHLERLQLALQEKGLYVGDLTDRRGRFHMSVERFDSVCRLLDEKERGIREKIDYAENTLLTSSKRAGNARAEMTSLSARKSEEESKCQAAKAQVSEYEEEYHSIRQKRQSLDDESKELAGSIKSMEISIEQKTNRIARMREDAAAKETRLRTLTSRCDDLLQQCEAYRSRLEELGGSLEQDEAALAELALAVKQATDKLNEADIALARTNEAINDCQNDMHAVSGQIAALEALDRRLSAKNESQTWIRDRAQSREGGAQPLSSFIKAPVDLEPAVEALLGDDLNGFVFNDAEEAFEISRELIGLDKVGDSSFAYPFVGSSAKKTLPGDRLFDLLDVDDRVRTLVEFLIGDVVVIDEEDVLAQGTSSHDGDARFVTRDGRLLLGPASMIRVFGKSKDNDSGALARRRNLESLRQRRSGLEDALEKLSRSKSEQQEAYDGLRHQNLDLAQDQAQRTGQRNSSRSEQKRVMAQLATAEAQLANSKKELDTVESGLSQVLPDIKGLELAVEAEKATRNELLEKQAVLSSNRASIASREQESNIRLNDARYKLNVSNDQLRSISRQLLNAELTISQSDEELRNARVQLASLKVARDRIDPLRGVILSLRESATSWVEDLAQKAALEQSSSMELNASITSARDEVKSRTAGLEKAREGLNVVRVNKGRLEVQVDSAVSAIVDGLGVPLETALQIPAPEDRAQLEGETFKLRKRISSMGSIDSSAAQEYDQCKERYDFISSQIDDIEAARASLRKILVAIDKKMSEQFLVTFDQVNSNFSEIFSILFPGGSASLELIDDDPDDLGVEVNAQPRGKKITKMMLMSGGEKSLTAIALLFAIYRIRSTPFYILDEVEAALDDSNLRRLTAFIEQIRTEQQLILITHQRRTMEMADVLYGVSMQSDGVTKVVSQKLDHGKAVESAS